MAKKIFISGEIGWETTPANIRSQLIEAKGGDIDVHIASPGGYVYEGFEIYNMLRDYKRENPASQIMIVLKGLAASMASYIACCPVADMVVAEDNAVFMIHNTWSYSAGDHREMRKTADLLEGLSSISAKAYAQRTGKSQADMQALMDAETWFFGQEIMDAGFVDMIIDAEDKDADKDKSRAISTGKVKLKAVIDKMQKDERGKGDLDRAAAHIKSEPGNSSRQTLDDIRARAQAQKEKNIPAATGGKNNNQEEVNMNLDQLKKDHPALHAEIVAEGVKHEQERMSAEAEKLRVPTLIQLKTEFKDSPLKDGVNDIIEKAILDEKNEKPQLADVLKAIAKWITSGSAVAALECAGTIGAGQSGSASGEQSSATESNWE